MMNIQNQPMAFQPPQMGIVQSAEETSPTNSKKKSRTRADPTTQKRRCVSTACIACRKRKSKCDGAVPSCAACASVYGTECIYDPNSDHRRKGVYREKIDSMKARSSTLQILIEAILNASEDNLPNVVRKIRTCDSLDAVAESILKQEYSNEEQEDDDSISDEYTLGSPDEGERDLARKMGELRLENGSARFIGGTSHLIYLGDPQEEFQEPEANVAPYHGDPVCSWTQVTNNTEIIWHLMNMYFSWHYPYFTTLSRQLFFRDFLRGRNPYARGTVHCSSLLVNAMLALGCHFSNQPAAYGTAGDSKTKGDHFFQEAKRLIIDNDEYEKPRLATVQALALMSVREAGCGREAKGWVYSGMSFRMAQDLGLNLDTGGMDADKGTLHEQEVDARRITFWGCFLFDKCWSNYLGRLPQLHKTSYNVPKFDVFPTEDADMWCPYTDSGFDQSAKQPARTRAVALQLSKLCEISSDLLLFFYHPNAIGRSSGKSVELKKLSELHRRLEDWRKELPREFEPKDGQLPNVLLMHMFFHLQYIHLFRPFLKYTASASPLPSHVSPRRICSSNAGNISKLMRLYKKTYNLRQICNIAVYMIHSACTIHLLNLPEKTAKRDVIHSVKHLEEIAEDWLCGRRTLSILSVLARKWNVELPEEASIVLKRTDEKFGTFATSDVPSPPRSNQSNGVSTPSPPAFPSSPPMTQQDQYSPVAGVNGIAVSKHGNGSEVLNPTSLAPEMLRIPGMMVPQMAHNMNGMMAPSPTMGHPMSATGGTAIHIPDNSGSNGGWGQQAATTGTGTQGMTVGSYGQQPQQQHTYSDMSSTATTSTHGSRTSTRQVSPNTAFASVDGQSWYLNDGASWRHNWAPSHNFFRGGHQPQPNDLPDLEILNHSWDIPGID
ncbi:nitrogen assimilation transcription factor nira [Zalerion maritima]|uniref:Nitrogen assimilation transcription factor nira n=1 Tax=Zalerion maritima TaxID=339359 RepID=A0AAD5RZA8_9PEZI|nr:nitrogen assimilation transcription factor nira [Zalerion maritima]